jgi:hypothetical protein
VVRDATAEQHSAAGPERWARAHKFYPSRPNLSSIEALCSPLVNGGMKVRRPNDALAGQDVEDPIVQAELGLEDRSCVLCWYRSAAVE